MNLPKAPLVGIAVLALSACETAPLDDDFDQEARASVLSTRHGFITYEHLGSAGQGLSANPRAYLDDGDAGVQKMLSNYDRTP